MTVVDSRGGSVPDSSAQADLSVRLRASRGAFDWKRLFDITVAALALVVLSPLIALLALAVWWVFFSGTSYLHCIAQRGC